MVGFGDESVMLPVCEREESGEFREEFDLRMRRRWWKVGYGWGRRGTRRRGCGRGRRGREERDEEGREMVLARRRADRSAEGGRR